MRAFLLLQMTCWSRIGASSGSLCELLAVGLQGHIKSHSTDLDSLGEGILVSYLLWDLTDLPVVHGVEDWRVTHPLADPQLDANTRVEEQHGCQREQEKGHHDEGGVGLPVRQRGPTFLTAHVVMVIQEVVLHLRELGRQRFSPWRPFKPDIATLTGVVFIWGFVTRLNGEVMRHSTSLNMKKEKLFSKYNSEYAMLYSLLISSKKDVS